MHVDSRRTHKLPDGLCYGAQRARNGLGWAYNYGVTENGGNLPQWCVGCGDGQAGHELAEEREERTAEEGL